MNYRISQYNYSPKSSEFNSNNFMAVIDSSDIWEAARINTLIDSNSNIILGATNTEECVKLSRGKALNSENIYYLHAKIKRMASDMTIYVQLTNYNLVPAQRTTQYLQTINIQKGNNLEWYDFEIIFKPLTDNFDCIVFQLQRTVADFDGEGYRIPIILYEELSIVKNFKTNLTGNKIIKMGVQARPGVLMCINGQGIHIGRNGIYEVRNGIVYVDYFSIVKAATEIEDGETLIQGEVKKVDGKDEILHEGLTLEQFLYEMAISNKYINLEEGKTFNECIFNHPKERIINAFTIDYMYEVENKE